MPSPPLIIRTPILIALVALQVIIQVGAVGYMWIEGWSYSEGLWMMTITLTTVGYNEVRPLSELGRLWTALMIISGLSVGTYGLTQLTWAVMEGEVSGQWRKKRILRLVKKMQDHVIIVGGGRLGEAVVEELTEAKIPVCVIERDPDRAAKLEPFCPVIIGDGANDDVLRLAGIARARGLAVTTPAGAEAIFVVLSARHLSDTLCISARAEDPEQVLKTKRAGANSVISPYHMGGWRMAHGLIRPEASTFIDLATKSINHELLIDELVVGERLRGHALWELELRRRYEVLVVAIRTPGGELLATPDADTKLKQDDVMIVIGRPEAIHAFSKEL